MHNTSKNKPYSQKSLTKENSPIVIFVTLFMVFAEILFTAFVLIKHGNNLKPYVPNLISYWVTIAISILVFLACRKSKGKNSNLAFIAQLFYLIYITAWGLFITYLDYQDGGHVAVFLTLILGISCLTFMSKTTAIIFFPLETIAFITLLHHVRPTTGTAFTFNLVVFNIIAMVGSFIKIMHYNQEMEAKESLLHLSYHDNLTGLLNRNALDRDFKEYVGCHTFILLVDIDDFKMVNDAHGHAKGDELLVSTANLLSDIFGSNACYRYGGDEFLVIHPNPPANWKEWLQTTHTGCTLSGSYTTTVLPDDDRKLFKVLDCMLYDSKAKGKNKIQQTKLSCR